MHIIASLKTNIAQVTQYGFACVKHTLMQCQLIGGHYEAAVSGKNDTNVNLPTKIIEGTNTNGTYLLL